MNQILLSFLCGAAFIGGAAATLTLVLTARTLMDKKNRDELMSYWKGSLEKHDKQLDLLERIALSMEKRKDV